MNRSGVFVGMINSETFIAKKVTEEGDYLILEGAITRVIYDSQEKTMRPVGVQPPPLNEKLKLRACNVCIMYNFVVPDASEGKANDEEGS